MRILRLDRLRPGDVILETGMPEIAAATGGPYGHASVALGGLVKIEAENVDGGVVLNPFDFAAWHRGEERVVGVPVGSEDVLVLRKRDLDIGVLDGEALREAGRRYSLPKLLELPDLDSRWRRVLERKLEKQSETPNGDAEGRFCSEVAARVLRLPSPNLSPNLLARAEGFEAVLSALEDLDDDWIQESTATASATLTSLVSKVRLGLAKEVIKATTRAAEAVKAQTISPKFAASNLEESISAELREAIRLLRSIRALEPTILHTATSTI